MAAAADTTSKARIGVLGASGYTGAELVRLLLRHPRAEIVLLTADRRAGQEMGRCFRNSRPTSCRSWSRLTASTGRGRGSIVAFCALPHATTQKVIAELLARRRDQGGRPLRRLPARRPGRLRTLVRPRAPCAAPSAGGSLRPRRGLPRRGQDGAARRQSGLLHHVRAACAHSAAARKRHRSRTRS